MIPKTKTVNISTAACAVIGSMECQRYNSGFVHFLKPPTEKVPAKVYAEAKKAIILIGGEWKPGRCGPLSGGFYFKDNNLTLEEMTKVIKTGVVYNKQQSTQFFETPPELAKRMAHLVRDCLAGNHSPRILEPSAGHGAIIDALVDVGFSTGVIDAIELQHEACNVLCDKYPMMNVVRNDFGSVYGHSGYDAVVMNPPFDRNLWQKHILHAIKFMESGGILVAVVPRSANLQFLSPVQRKFAVLTPIKAEFGRTSTKVSILTLWVNKRAIQSAFSAIEDNGEEETKPLLKSHSWHLKQLRKNVDEINRVLNELEEMI